jgi:Domain of unknown function (DUF4395)
MTTMIDVNVPRFNQACVAVVTGLAFVLQIWVLVPVLAMLLAATRLGGPRYALFTQVYVRLLRPRLRGPIETEAAEPPRFAQVLGIVFLTAASALFVIGATGPGWIVTLMVTALATLAATTRICVGCMIYERAVR